MYNFLLFSDVLYGRTFTIPMFWHKFLQLFRKFRDRMLEKAKIQPGVSNFSSPPLSHPLPPSPPWNFISVPARGIVGASFIALYTPRYYFHRFTDFYIFELMNIKACGFNLFPRPPNGNYFSCSGGGEKKKKKKKKYPVLQPRDKNFFFFFFLRNDFEIWIFGESRHLSVSIRFNRSTVGNGYSISRMEIYFVVYRRISGAYLIYRTALIIYVNIYNGTFNLCSPLPPSL